MATKPYTNNTVRASQHCQEYNLGLSSNYSVKTRADDTVQIDNLTAPKYKELFSFAYKEMPTVTTDARVEYPAPRRTGYQIRVRSDTVLQGTAPDGVTPYEAPLVMYLVVNAPDALCTPADLEEAFERLVSALHSEDGSWRWTELSRKTLVPKAD